jgi:hypothetical protein
VCVLMMCVSLTRRGHGGNDKYFLSLYFNVTYSIV